MIVTFWKGIFVVDKPEDRSVLTKAGFEPHEPSLCTPDKRCKACYARIGNRWWSNRVESATRLRSYCNQLALSAIKTHVDKLAKSRAVTSDILVPAPQGLKYAPYQLAGIAFIRDHKDTLLGDDMGLGKEQPLDAKILTPYGWTTMGEVKKGQLIIGSDGLSYPVENVYPQGVRKVFRVTFQDGATTECGEDHLWEVNTPLRRKRKNPPKILTTRQIMDIGLKDKNNHKHFVRLVEPCDHKGRPLFVDPYVIGYLLGNGGLSQVSAHVTIPDRESVERISSLLPQGFILSPQTSPIEFIVTTTEHKPGRPNAFLDHLRKIDLMGYHSYEKKIPHNYLWTSTQNRISLLQGLIDSDGHVRPLDGNIEYSSSSLQLAKDVQHLVWSLGGTARIRPKTTKCRVSYRMSVRLPNNIVPCRLARKLQHNIIREKYPPCRSIINIEFVGHKETQCLAVNSPDRLYVTDDYILTHNTIQALGFVNHLRSGDPKPKSVLIVCPSTLRFNWRQEIERWLVKPMTVIIPTGPKFEVPKQDNIVVITNYEKLIGVNPFTESLKRVWDVLVCDEAQALKTWNTKRSQAILGREGLLQRAHRFLALTGTPIENYPKEIWPLAAAICPAKFGDRIAFLKRYCGLHDEKRGGNVVSVDTGATNLGELQQRLRASFMLRRLKSDVLKELPPKRRQLVTLNDAQADWSRDPDFRRWRELYERDYEAKLAALEAAKTQVEYRLAVRALDEFTGVAFQEMSDFRHRTALAKLPACIEYIDDMLTAGLDKLVIFAHHQDVLAKLAEHYGDQAVSLHGATRQQDREKVVRAFQEGDKKIFIGGLKAAGIGLNLYAASTVVFIEIDWNPAVLSQAEDRLCRMGQKKMVHVIHLVLDGTLDVNICKRVVAKQEVIDKALNRLPDHGLKLPSSPSQMGLPL